MPLRSSLLFFLLGLAAALAVIGARWSLIERSGSPVPIQDQWYAEGEDMYLWTPSGGPPWSRFLKPNNDHHIVPTRLLAYALFRANDQWDVRVQMMVGALLAGLLCLPLLALVRPWVTPPTLALSAGLLAAFGSATVLFENALWGFQSQFYFLVFFSLVHLLLMLGRRPFSFGWWLGLGSGLCATASMGSGLLAPVAVALVSAWRWWREPPERRAVRPTLAASSLLALAGAVWLPPHVTGGPHFQPSLFLHTLGLALTFPERGFSVLGLLLWLPFALWLAVQGWKRDVPAAARVLLAAGLWALAQAAAIAWARPETSPVIPNRYGDVLLVGLVVNFVALACLHRHARSRFARTLVLAAAAAWLALVGRHAWLDVQVFRREYVPLMARLRVENTDRIRRFYRNGDRAAILGATYPEIPVFDAPSLARDLAFPALADAMPFELRNSISLQFPEDSAHPPLARATPIFLPNQPGEIHRGTYFPGLAAAGMTDVTSAPAAKHPRRELRFEVAGDLRAGETELRIHDRHGAVVATITDFKADTLTPVVVSVPGDAFQVEVFDRSATRWLAFLDPVEIGPLSHVALTLLPAAGGIAFAGWILLGGLLLGLIGRAARSYRRAE